MRQLAWVSGRIVADEGVAGRFRGRRLCSFSLGRARRRFFAGRLPLTSTKRRSQMTYYAPEKVQGAKTDQLFRVVGLLPEEKVAQVLDFAQFILWQETKSPDETTAFERWAEKLARNRGFAHLSEDDVACIVHESRAERK
jgi:hypothetical protein